MLTEAEKIKWTYHNRPDVRARWMKELEQRQPYSTLDARWVCSDTLEIGENVLLHDGDEATHHTVCGVDNRNRSVLLELGNPRKRRWVAMQKLQRCINGYRPSFYLDKRLPDSVRMIMLENRLKTLGRVI